jgi:hypothetical protein
MIAPAVKDLITGGAIDIALGDRHVVRAVRKLAHIQYAATGLAPAPPAAAVLASAPILLLQ